MIIEKIFFDHYQSSLTEFSFDRREIGSAAQGLHVEHPKNLGDVVYHYRYRDLLPQKIRATLPPNLHWIILGAGDAVYCFRHSKLDRIEPAAGLLVRKIPDSTPEIIAKYALNDEQALLAKIRYNRLIDTFLGITAYSLQNHLRTKIPTYGQIEIDELYVGVDARGAQYVIPIQAKGGTDALSVIQTIQDTMFCNSKAAYKHCLARPVSAQFMANDVIVLFELTFDGSEVSIKEQKHYQLVPAKQISDAELATYRIS